MSLFSKALRSVAKHSIAGKLQDKTYKALGISSGNTLRRAIDPGSIQREKIAKGAPINARLLVDPGNEIQAAPTKVAEQQAQINPLTGQPGTNARDLIAQQMSGAPMGGSRPVVNPGVGNAGSPSYGFGTLSQIPGQSRQPAAPPPDYGDIGAIMDYVQGKRSGPGAPPMGGAPMGAPQKQPMFGPGRRFT
jgi:hypothetical protein